MVDIGIPIHDSIVKIWDSTNEKIEDKMEELREEKEVLKASNRELMDYIRSTLGSTSTRTFDSNVENNKNLLLKLQQ